MWILLLLQNISPSLVPAGQVQQTPLFGKVALGIEWDMINVYFDEDPGPQQESKRSNLRELLNLALA